MDPRFRIDPIRDLESLHRYEVGGFHPVHIGEELHDRRYEVLHRLGNGHFSTVWLAEDMYITDRPTDSPRTRYVAIKIFAADFHPDKYDGDRLWDLRESSLDTKDFSVKDGLRHVVTALNEFEISGPNGTHQALVMELLGPSVASVIYEQPIPVELSRRIILQLAKALASLHSLGMVHGDVTLRNIMFTLPNSLQSLSRKELLDTLGGVPLIFSVNTVLYLTCRRPSEPKPGWPQYLVKLPDPTLLFRLSTASGQSSIRLVDFTESFKLPYSSLHLPGTPIFEAAPELLLQADSAITEKIDVWAFSCVAYEVFSPKGAAPLHGWIGRGYQVATIFQKLRSVGGGIPDEFKKLYVSQGWCIPFDDSEPRNGTPVSGHDDLDEMLRKVMNTGGATEADVEGLRVLWQMALRINPLERVPMTEIIRVLQGIWG